MGTPMKLCVSLIFPITLFSCLKNLNRQDTKGKSRISYIEDRTSKSVKKIGLWFLVIKAECRARYTRISDIVHRKA